MLNKKLFKQICKLIETGKKVDLDKILESLGEGFSISPQQYNKIVNIFYERKVPLKLLKYGLEKYKPIVTFSDENFTVKVPFNVFEEIFQQDDPESDLDSSIYGPEIFSYFGHDSLSRNDFCVFEHKATQEIIKVPVVTLFLAQKNFSNIQTYVLCKDFNHQILAGLDIAKIAKTLSQYGTVIDEEDLGLMHQIQAVLNEVPEIIKYINFEPLHYLSYVSPENKKMSLKALSDIICNKTFQQLVRELSEEQNIENIKSLLSELSPLEAALLNWGHTIQSNPELVQNVAAALSGESYINGCVSCEDGSLRYIIPLVTYASEKWFDELAKLMIAQKNPFTELCQRNSGYNWAQSLWSNVSTIDQDSSEFTTTPVEIDLIRSSRELGKLYIESTKSTMQAVEFNKSEYISPSVMGEAIRAGIYTLEQALDQVFQNSSMVSYMPILSNVLIDIINKPEDIKIIHSKIIVSYPHHNLCNEVIVNGDSKLPLISYFLLAGKKDIVDAIFECGITLDDNSISNESLLIQLLENGYDYKMLLKKISNLSLDTIQTLITQGVELKDILLNKDINLFSKPTTGKDEIVYDVLIKEFRATKEELAKYVYLNVMQMAQIGKITEIINFYKTHKELILDAMLHSTIKILPENIVFFMEQGAQEIVLNILSNNSANILGSEFPDPVRKWLLDANDNESDIVLKDRFAEVLDRRDPNWRNDIKIDLTVPGGLSRVDLNFVIKHCPNATILNPVDAVANPIPPLNVAFDAANAPLNLGGDVLAGGANNNALVVDDAPLIAANIGLPENLGIIIAGGIKIPQGAAIKLAPGVAEVGEAPLLNDQHNVVNGQLAIDNFGNGQVAIHNVGNGMIGKFNPANGPMEFHNAGNAQVVIHNAGNGQLAIHRTEMLIDHLYAQNSWSEINTLAENPTLDLSRSSNQWDEIYHSNDSFRYIVQENAKLASNVICTVARKKNLKAVKDLLKVEEDVSEISPFHINAEHDGKTILTHLNERTVISEDDKKWFFAHGYVPRNTELLVTRLDDVNAVKIVDSGYYTQVHNPYILRAGAFYMKKLLAKIGYNTEEFAYYASRITKNIDALKGVNHQYFKLLHLDEGFKEETLLVELQKHNPAIYAKVIENNSLIRDEIVNLACKALGEKYLDYSSEINEQNVFKGYAHYIYKYDNLLSPEELNNIKMTLANAIGAVAMLIHKSTPSRDELVEMCKDAIVNNREKAISKFDTISWSGDEKQMEQGQMRQEQAQIYELLNPMDDNSLIELFSEMTNLDPIMIHRQNKLADFAIQIYMTYNTYSYKSTACKAGAYIQVTQSICKIIPEVIDQLAAYYKSLTKEINAYNLTEMPEAQAPKIIAACEEDEEIGAALEWLMTENMVASEVDSSKQKLFAIINQTFSSSINAILPELRRLPTGDEYKIIIALLTAHRAIQEYADAYAKDHPEDLDQATLDVLAAHRKKMDEINAKQKANLEEHGEDYFEEGAGEAAADQEHLQENLAVDYSDMPALGSVDDDVI